MEEIRPARPSSGIFYEGNHGFGASAHSLADSDAPLANNAAPAAGAAGATGAATGATAGDATGATAQQPHVPWYKTRKFIISQLIIIPLGIALLFILLYPVVTAIAQSIVNKTTLNVDVAEISNAGNDSFTLTMKGYVAHTGIFSAKIQFTEPIDISWKEDDGTQTALGSMIFTELHADNKRAIIDQTTTFNISDEDAFGRFAAHMITAENFTWTLHSENLHVQAEKFPVSKGIKFNKDLTLNGFNSFNGNVKLKELKLPSDNKAGGIDFSATTSLNNPSPFKLSLGTVQFDLTYQDVFLGTGTGTDTVIAPKENDITLNGYLVSHTDENELKAVSELFTNYINGDASPVIATGKSTLQPDGSAISWLSVGLQSLKLNVPFASIDGAISPIKSISIGTFDLTFFEDTPWAPAAASDNVQATLELPFGFNLDIKEISNDFNITQNNKPVAGLKTPIGASASNVAVYSSTNTSGTIDIKITNTNLSCPDPQHETFSVFNTNLTNLRVLDFQMIGNSRAVTNTSVGLITLDPIKVNVTTNLLGLQGLNGLAAIQNVDVLGGTKEGIDLGINVTIKNPSNLNLYIGDLNLQLFREGGYLGTTLMPNLTLNMGENNIAATSIFAANDDPKGLETLKDFVGKKDVGLSISGYDESTEITPLLEAFKTLAIEVTLPALTEDLLSTASLEVLSTTGIENDITHVSVDLNNPFTADLRITKIKSTVASYGLELGTIEQETTFESKGKSTTTSPDLNLALNLDPATIFTLTRALAVEAGLQTDQLDGIVELGGYDYKFTTGSDPSNRKRDNIYTGFELPPYVQEAFKKLKSDITLSTELTIGEYSTTLEYEQKGLPTKTDDSLNYLLPLLARPIVQKIVDGSGITIDTVTILDPKQESFGTKLIGGINNAGPFDATLSFGPGLTVSWNGKALGTMKLDDVKVTGDVGGTIDASSAFLVSDVGHLTDFTKTLLNEENFEWEITADNLTVTALGISVSDIKLPSKKVTLAGFNGLKNGVKIQTFDLPENDPNGGIHLTLVAATTNPSQVGIELSSLSFDTYVGDVMIAPVSAEGGVTLAAQSTSNLSLAGRLVPQDNEAGLATVSAVFNNFIQGKNSDVIVQGAGAGPSDVTWLNEGIKTLRISTELPNQGKQEIIKSVALNEMTLLFEEDVAYRPPTSSKSTDAAFQIPFGFPLDIKAVAQNITVSFDGNSIAELVIPEGDAVTDVEQRIIHLTFSDVPFAVFDDQHGAFENFLAATTTGKTQTLGLAGTANTKASTAVGLLSLGGIDFSVQSNIEGLQGLNTKPVTVSNLDVAHGYPDYLLITVDSAIFNPSNLTIGTDDVAFALQYMGATIGTANIADLIIRPGNGSYATDVHFQPEGGAVDAGRALLQNFIQGVDVDTTIQGTRDATPIDSLKTALSQVTLSPVTIPALHETLIKSVSLVFPTDIVQTGIADSTFTLANPFTASINLLRVGAKALYHGILLGEIKDVDVSSNPIHADGHSSVTSQTLPLNYNLDPVTIIQFLSIAAQENHVDLGPAADLFKLILDNPDFHPPVNTSVATEEPTCVSGNQFDVEGAILATLKNLAVDLQVSSAVNLDEFPTDLAFNQTGVPAMTDETALYLIGAVSAPIAQLLVNNAVLQFTEANITNISDDGFDLSLVGSLTGTGPLDALIEFTEPVVVNWEGSDIATIELPPICAAANVGVPDYRTNARLSLTDLSRFTEFATYLLHNEAFNWTISSSNVRLTALGTIFDGVELTKSIGFEAFNGLPGVTISNFQLPSDDPEGGIHIETDSMIPSPSQLGIDLGTVTFKAYFDDVYVGPLSGDNLFLAAETTTNLHLAGRIVPQDGNDINVIGDLFSHFLAGDNQTLSVAGESVQPAGSNGPVSWLSTAFQTLTLEVILPGHKYDIIDSISLVDLGVILQEQEQAYAPLTSSNSTSAQYKNPFGFSLQVVESGQDITLASSGVDIAQLNIPQGPVEADASTGNLANLQITWADVPLQSLNDAAFNAMFDAVTNLGQIPLTLKGTADVVAKTSIGNVPIAGIPFDVPSSLNGIDGFGHKTELSDVKITGSGGDQYIRAELKATLDNPSNVSLSTVDIELDVVYKDVVIGSTVLDQFNLLPGHNVMEAEFRYQPSDANNTVAQEFISSYLSSDEPLPLTVKGTSDSSPFGSLQTALSHVTLGTSLTGLGVESVKHINVYIALSTLVDSFVAIDFDVYNPLDAPLTISFLQTEARVEGELYAIGTVAIEPFTIQPGETTNSGRVEGIFLTKGAIASLPIIPLGYLDLANSLTVSVGDYTIPWLRLNQDGIPTTYTIDLGLAGFRAAAESMSSVSVHGSETSSVAESTSGSASSTGGGGTSATPTKSDSDEEPSKTDEPQPSKAEDPQPTKTEEPEETKSRDPQPTSSEESKEPEFTKEPESESKTDGEEKGSDDSHSDLVDGQ